MLHAFLELYMAQIFLLLNEERGDFLGNDRMVLVLAVGLEWLD